MTNIKIWVKDNWKFVSAASVATIALVLGMKGCSDNDKNAQNIAAVNAKVARVESGSNRTDSLLTENITALQGQVNANAAGIRGVNNRLDNVEERLDSVEFKVDSVIVPRVDTIAARQEKCPCINSTKAKRHVVKQPDALPKSSKAEVAPAPAAPVKQPVVPVKQPVVVRDTVFVEKPVEQNAQGCGNNQNANVVIGDNSSNNTVVINNGVKDEEPKVTVTRRTRIVVKTYGYCGR